MDPNMLWHFQELFRRLCWLGEQQLKLERQLTAIEQQLNSLGQTLAGMEDRPCTHIDKIEYRFEQLKVDTLSGKLQIGLAHGAEGMIEELGVNQKTAQDVKLDSNGPDAMFPRLAAGVRSYIDNGLYRDIDEASRTAQVELPPELRERIAEDLARQLQDRLIVYIKEIPTKEGPDETAEKTILDKVVADVRSGLKQYFVGYGKEQSP